jgi:hypothetical protein
MESMDKNRNRTKILTVKMISHQKINTSKKTYLMATRNSETIHHKMEIIISKMAIKIIP